MQASDGSRYLGTHRERSSKNFAGKFAFRIKKAPPEPTPEQILYREEKQRAQERRDQREKAAGIDESIERAREILRETEAPSRKKKQP